MRMSWRLPWVCEAAGRSLRTFSRSMVACPGCSSLASPDLPHIFRQSKLSFLEAAALIASSLVSALLSFLTGSIGLGIAKGAVFGVAVGWAVAVENGFFSSFLASGGMLTGFLSSL